MLINCFIAFLLFIFHIRSSKVHLQADSLYRYIFSSPKPSKRQKQPEMHLDTNGRFNNTEFGCDLCMSARDENG